jgi:hypothetical protein
VPYNLGDKIPLRWDRGPISFGLVLSESLVSWSGPEARDLLVGRCWEGIFLYPTRELGDAELARDPLQVFPASLGDVHAVPVDWNRDGRDDLIAANRTGFLYPLARRGEYPDLSFALEEPLRDGDTGLVFNIPYENPNHPALDDLGGYFDRGFFDYLYPVVYPAAADPRLQDLIIGDWAGNLWWLPDLSGGEGRPQYRGVPYDKRDEDLPTKRGKELIARYGRTFAKPGERIADERGAPFLLGVGSDTGGKRYQGGNARPVLYRNPRTGSPDLLVLAGTLGNVLYYLERADTGPGRRPVFRNRGEVPIRGVDRWDELLFFHSKIAVHPAGGRNDLLLSLGSRIAFLEECGRGAMPEYELARIASADGALAGCNYISEILADRQGRRYTVESWGNTFECREILRGPSGAVRLSSRTEAIRDQRGVFAVKGETDPQGGESWGWHRVGRWDFDGSGRQHLVVGTDKGLLYLLIAESEPDAGGGFRFRSHGPLADADGRVIKVHNRAVAAGLDLDGDGCEDLVVGGCSYQAGIPLDPAPGGGVYYLLNRGLDDRGLPVLSPLAPLATEGYAYDRRQTNAHLFVQVLDIDGDGRKEVLIAVQWQDAGRLHVLRPAAGRIALVDTGEVVPQERPIEEWVLDVDGDGQWEMVFSGSENGVGYYRALRRQP